MLTSILKLMYVCSYSMLQSLFMRLQDRKQCEGTVNFLGSSHGSSVQVRLLYSSTAAKIEYLLSRSWKVRCLPLVV